MKKTAFTLAEILITLGIIGIVAAITLPGLIQSYQNRVVETRLKQFYSIMNQTIKRAEYDYEGRESWFEDLYGVDEDGNLKGEKWINKYIAPYAKIINIKKVNNYTVMYFMNGSSAALPSSNGRDWFFFPGDAEKCLKKVNSIGKAAGRCAFTFIWAPTNKRYYDFAPYTFGLDEKTMNNINTLKNHNNFGCNNTVGSPNYCTQLIKLNGWKIPSDYPFKVRIY